MKKTLTLLASAALMFSTASFAEDMSNADSNGMQQQQMSQDSGKKAVKSTKKSCKHCKKSHCTGKSCSCKSNKHQN